MNTNKKLTTQEIDNHRLLLERDAIQTGLTVLENAHYSVVVTIEKIKETVLLHIQKR